MKWNRPKEVSRKRRNATFHMLLHGKGQSAIIGLDIDLRDVMYTYHEINKHNGIAYPLVIELAPTSKKAAALVLTYIETIFKVEIINNDYPYTLDWTHVVHFPAVKLTIGIRPCDLREFV